MKNNLNKTLGFFLIVLLVLIGVKFYQKTSLEGDLKDLKQGISGLSDSIKVYDESNFRATVLAKDLTDYLDGKEIPWSNVLSKISDTIPEDRSGEKIMNVLSYSGSFGNELLLNVSTVGGSSSPYEDVAKFISAFDSSKYFTNNFVPSIAFGLNTEGKEVLTFSFQTNYEENFDYEEEKVPVMR